MKLVILTGPHAVGKMTIGQHLAGITDLRLFHNHMTIDLAAEFFSYSTPEGRALVARLREEIFQAVARSDLEGMIFTYLWAFDLPEEHDYIKTLAALFSDKGAPIYVVELEADLDTRIARNTTSNRLAHKPSKRDLKWSENELLRSAEKYRLNSLPGEVTFENYMKIDTTAQPAEETARLIKDRFQL